MAGHDDARLCPPIPEIMKNHTPVIESAPDRPVTVHHQLRQATHAAHVRLNLHPLLAGLTRADFPLSNYRLILATYHRFFRVVEPAILDGLAANASEFSYADRQKLSWLAEDIAALGGALPPPQTRRVIAVPGDAAERIGMLYAIEGSTLGGQVISRHLKANLGLSPERGARFFFAYGADTENRWASFCAYAEGLSGDPVQCRRAGEAALNVFNILEALLDDGLHQPS